MTTTPEQPASPPKKTRNRHPSTSLAVRARRLGLTLKDIEKLTHAPYENIKNWHQGRTRTPKIVLRMLSVYRLLNWGKF